MTHVEKHIKRKFDHSSGEVWKQFGSDLVSSELDFVVGYMKGNSNIDIQNVWTSVDKGDSINVMQGQGVQTES